MYVRLAFAVAAHLQPEILIVDEVLAVGDASFQRKCLGRMAEVARGGRTVVLVSHNMAAIRSLTETTLWLDAGRLAASGVTEDVVARYLATHAAAGVTGAADLTSDDMRRDAGKQLARRVSFTSVAIRRSDGLVAAVVPAETPLTVDIVFEVDQPVRFLELVIRVRTMDGTLIFGSFSGQHDVTLPRGRYAASCSVEDNLLRPGRYTIELVAASTQPEDIVPRALTFEIEEGHVAHDNPRSRSVDQVGLVRVDSRWSEIESASPQQWERSFSGELQA
jgi:lipopolysaccharide transport system ATP-binding protein